MKALVATGGSIQTVEQSAPAVKPNFVLIETLYSAISPGTEISMRQAQRGEPISLGYSAAGVVKEIGAGVSHVRIGQKVACYGAPFVRHAGVLCVPKHLVAPIEDAVDLREAAFAGLGAIAIHALRQANLQFGEKTAVVGLGILGQLVGRIAHAAAYGVIGYDLLPERCLKLKEAGVRHVYDQLAAFAHAIDEATRGQGVDSVIICAGKNALGITDLALKWIRDRGKVLIVGDVKAEFDRGLMFQKEAQVLISRAGGPGRYDRDYEINGFDYPLGYVRWTEGRNVEEYIRLLAENRISVAPLISRTIPIGQASEAYRLLTEEAENHIGVLLSYE